MSEMDTTPSSAGSSGPETSGAPETGGPPDAGGGERVSTQAISASVLDELEAGDDGTTEIAETTTTAPVTEPKAQESVVDETEADKLLKDAGYAAKKQDGRDNWIKYSSVRKIIDNQLTKGRTADQARVTSIEQERDTYKADMEEFGRDVRGDPRAFLDKLARVDQRYQAFLTPPPAAPGSIPAGQDDPEPAPDLDLGNGRVSYSLDGLRKLREWDKRQYERAVDAKLKPFTERDQQVQAQQERGRLEQAIRTRAQDQITKAESWPLFGKYDPANLTEFQQAVLKELDADKALSFFDAYMKVATPRLATDRNAVREEVLKEINGAPKSTAVPKTGGEAPRAQRPTSIRDTAATVYDELASRR
jgi:hypothetical protein